MEPANQTQNGREAFEKVKADMELGQHYDIIFMDIQVRSFGALVPEPAVNLSLI